MPSRNGSIIILLSLSGVAVGGMNFRLKYSNCNCLVWFSTIFSLKKKSNFNAYFSFFTRSPRHMNSVERLGQMSPAAQRLASQKLGIRTGTDKSLRASYTPSPNHRLSVANTPTHSQPSTPSASKHYDSTPEMSSLTDNLLNLPKHWISLVDFLIKTKLRTCKWTRQSSRE